MRQIRYSTFETNSSSTHTLIIVTKDQYEKLDNQELYLVDDWSSFADFEDMMTEPVYGNYHLADADLVEKHFHGDDEERHDDGVQTFTEWAEDDWLEVDENSFTSPSGDELIAVCKYGRDG